MNDLSLLSRYGFPDAMIDQWKEQGIDKLLPIQLEAIRQQKLFDDGNLIVSAPTSSGKTLIGEMAAIQQALDGKKSLYLVPLKALAEEKFKGFCNQCAGNGIKTVISTRDRKEFDQDIVNGDFHIAVVVYEKFFPLVSSTKQFINQFGLVVVDELQMLADPNRGSILELLLTWLRSNPGGPKIIGLSAVIGNDGELPKWLNAKFLRATLRPIELQMGYLYEGSYHYWESNSGLQGEEQWLDQYVGNRSEDTILAVKHLLDKQEQALVFMRDRASTRRIAQQLSEIVEPIPAEDAIVELESGEETLSRDELIDALLSGVAYHNADLTLFERNVIERNFRSGKIRALISTSTLAMGINLPAKNVFLDTERWYFEKGARPFLMPLTNAEFANMGGRAGRFGFGDTFGRAVVVAETPLHCYQFERTFLNGDIEELQPCLWKDEMSTAILLSVAVAGCKDDESISNFMRNSLSWHLHSNDADSTDKLNLALSRGLQRCLKVGLLKHSSTGKIELTELGEVVVHTGITVETAITLLAWLKLRGSDHINTIEALLACVISDDGFSDRFSLPTLEYKRRGNHYVQIVEEELGHELFTFFMDRLPSVSDHYEKAKSCKSALLLMDYITDFDNKELEAEYGVYFGAITRVAEQIGWLLEAATGLSEVISKRSSTQYLLDQLSDRVTYGVPHEGVFLARQRIHGLGRERMRSLIRFGVESVDTLLEISMSDLERIVTKPVAKRITAWLEASGVLEPQAIEVEDNSNDQGNQNTPVLKLIGHMERRRSSVEFGGQTLMLRDREFELLVRLARGRLDYEEGWISKFDLNLPDGGITQGISRLREALNQINMKTSFIESDHRGHYRLNLATDYIHFDDEMLQSHWSASVRELCEVE